MHMTLQHPITLVFLQDKQMVPLKAGNRNARSVFYYSKGAVRAFCEEERVWLLLLALSSFTELCYILRITEKTYRDGWRENDASST